MVLKICVLSIFILCNQGCISAQDSDKEAFSQNNKVQADKLETSSDYVGTWEITDYKFSGVSGLNETQAKSYVGQSIFLGKESAEIIDDNCENPKYDIKERKAKPYLHEMYRASANQLGFKSETIKILSLSCSNGSYEILIDEQNNLMLNIEGVFFSLEKVKIQKEFSFNGSGNFEKRIAINYDKGTKLKVDYHFYFIPDQLILIDANGNTLLDTKKKPTEKMKSTTVDLISEKGKTEYLVIRVKNEKGKPSSWRLNFTYIN